jgi:hypothetical protein
MIIRKMVLLAAMAALGLFAIGAASASASTTLLNAAGTQLASGSTIDNGGSDPAVLTLPGLGVVTCNNTAFTATVGASGGATITGSLSSLTFTTCSDTIPVINISSCHLSGSSPSILITATGDVNGTVALTDPTVFCAVSGSTSGCYYTAATASGTATNSTLAYSNVAVSHTTGTGDLGSLCGSSATFSATLTDLTSGGSTVHVTNT